MFRADLEIMHTMLIRIENIVQSPLSNKQYRVDNEEKVELLLLFKATFAGTGANFNAT